MITIDEAIQRCWEISNVDFEEARGIDKRDFQKISNWLEELKEITDSKDSGYNIGYTKAIDDFAEKLHRKIISEIDDCADELEWIDEIAEQLKAGGVE